MAEQMTLEQAQAATVKAQREKNSILATQKHDRALLKANQSAKLKVFSKAVNDALAAEMVIRRAQAKAEAMAAAEGASDA